MSTVDHLSAGLDDADAMIELAQEEDDTQEEDEGQRTRKGEQEQEEDDTKAEDEGWRKRKGKQEQARQRERERKDQGPRRRL